LVLFVMGKVGAPSFRPVFGEAVEGGLWM